tara:strand:- start:4705 stop:5712 length:1008 start_codon:yes stop_codon:yes gene_type:complete
MKLMNNLENNPKIDKCISIISEEYKNVSKYQLIYNGINSLIVKLKHLDSKESILKIYPSFVNDKRDRLVNEITFLKFLEINNINNCPKVLYFNQENNFSVLSWIEGIKLKDSRDLELEDVANFFCILNNSNLKKSNHLPLASEANFNLEETIKFINQIAQNKLVNLGRFSPDNYFSSWFRNVLMDDIFTTLSYVEGKFLLHKFNFENNKIISQSDVGLHNILVKNKKLFFIDFEYAGWDNPMKFISDWILQPDSFFPRKKPLDFFQPLVDSVINDINWKDNIEPYLLLNRIRWCLIISNKIFRLEESYTNKNREIFTKLKNYFLDSKNYIKSLYD